jgi:3-phenylpropionate/trans-cinnamate dioxygenase ferredoxin subunit
MEVKVCRLQDIPDDGILGAEVEGQRIILVRRGDRVYALEGTCTHEEFDLAQGVLVEDRIICTLHLSSFQLETGEVLSPPAERPLRTYRVILRGEEVYVEV